MADMTITIPDEDVTRVTEAYGNILNKRDAEGNPRDATPAEVDKAITDWLHQSTLDYERRKNMAAYSPPLFEGEPTATPTPTPGAAAAAALKTAPTPTPKKKK